MPRVRMKYLAPICDIVGKWEEELDVPEGSTLRSVIVDILFARYGAPFSRLFYDASGNFRPMFIIRHNERAMDDFDITVSDGDQFVFIPPIAGG